MLLSEQDIEQKPKLIHIGGSGGHLAQELLRCGIFRCECRNMKLRERDLILFLCIWIDELGDAEVEEFHYSRAGDEHVRGFQISMDHEVSVGMRDCGDHIEKESHPIANGKFFALAEFINALAVDVFQYE